MISLKISWQTKQLISADHLLFVSLCTCSFPSTLTQLDSGCSPLPWDTVFDTKFTVSLGKTEANQVRHTWTTAWISKRIRPQEFWNWPEAIHLLICREISSCMARAKQDQFCFYCMEAATLDCAGACSRYVLNILPWTCTFVVHPCIHLIYWKFDTLIVKKQLFKRCLASDEGQSNSSSTVKNAREHTCNVNSLLTANFHTKKQLVDKFRVYAVDLRGHGSGTSTIPTNYANLSLPVNPKSLKSLKTLKTSNAKTSAPPPQKKNERQNPCWQLNKIQYIK